MYLLKNLITPGILPTIVVILAAIAKNPRTSDEVKNVAIDKSQTPNSSNCFIINQYRSYIENVVEFHNQQFQKHQALKLS
jgi:hypothetical protein